MIIFHSTKRIGKQCFMVFTNEANSFVQIPVDDNTLSFFLHHFDRLSPGMKSVEGAVAEELEDE